MVLVKEGLGKEKGAELQEATGLSLCWFPAARRGLKIPLEVEQ